MCPKFGMFIPPHISLREQIRLAVLSEKLGYDSCWFPDHSVFLDQAPAIDCWTIMAAIACHTRRILLGTAVCDPHRCHPAFFAQRAATLDQLSQGRLIVGLGSGEAMNLDPFGIPWKDRKVGRVREFIQVFRGLLDSPEPLDYQGTHYQLKQARMSVRPYQERKIPLQLAALGPQMQALAGQLADGWKPVIVPAPLYDSYFDPIRQSALKAGRDPHQIERGVPFAFALFNGQPPTPEQAARAMRPYAGAMVWEPAMHQMGLPYNPPEHLRGVGYHTVDASNPDSWRLYQEFCDWLPYELLSQFVVFGNRQRVTQAVQQYVEAGVEHFEITNASPDPLTSTVWFAAEVMPQFTGRPPTALARALNLLLKPFAQLGLTRRLVPPDVDLWRKVGL